MKGDIKFVDTKQAIHRLKRRVDKCIYYNEDCFCKLKPIEMEQISVVLARLYQDYIEHKDDFDKHQGMKSEDLAKTFQTAAGTTPKDKRIKSIMWMLIPQFVNIKSYGYSNSTARKYKLNQTGILLVETLIKETEKKAEDNINQNENATAVIEDDDSEVLEEEINDIQ